eukprot:scaffold28101_cov73-Skeletonema_marinoi.AAC.2
MSSTEECASASARNMGLRTNKNNAVHQDAQTKPRMEEECVLDMGRRLSVVAVMGAATVSSTEECALDKGKGQTCSTIYCDEASNAGDKGFLLCPLSHSAASHRPRHKSKTKNQPSQKIFRLRTNDIA